MVSDALKSGAKIGVADMFAIRRASVGSSDGQMVDSSQSKSSNTVQ